MSDLLSHCNQISGEQDFYVLKFPSKLWRIICECRSGAIRWGPYGKTILIDYNLFQSEYLECEVPKFKTRNMTSFVRQLNMYGFKKMQQSNQKLSRYYNIHEFYHENFIFGRPDLLRLVKRKAIPLKFPKTNYNYDRKISRVELCRNTFEDSLLHSNEFRHFWKLSPLLSSVEGGSKVIQPAYKIRIIPAQNIEIDEDKKELTAVVLSDYEKLLHVDQEASLDEPEESNDEDNNDEDDFDPAIFDIDFAKTSDDNIFILNEGMKGIPVQVKNGFDGANYIIDVEESISGQANSVTTPPESEEIPMVTDVEDPPLPQQEEPPTVPEEEAAPTIHLPEDEDLLSCLYNAISGGDM